LNCRSAVAAHCWREDGGSGLLVTGVTGQDGAYLAEYLKRRLSSFNRAHRSSLHGSARRQCAVPLALWRHDGFDQFDPLKQQIRPTEIYNLAAQSHVGVSFESPDYTANADGIGVLRLLEAIRILGMEKEMRFYQASSKTHLALAVRGALLPSAVAIAEISGFMK
jgi:GDPmannose 4,6-dehydratase